ncbi:hypothetical protein LSUE1_G005832, partial [Lachnellula suecica]
MFWSALLAFAAFAQAAPQAGSTMLRFGCSQIVVDRIDPLVNPGLIPSPHMHQIVGGNAFNASIPSTDVSALAGCTTCSFADDFSNYWTANMYFKARNGSYKRVPQVPARLEFSDTFSTKISGGFIVYYVSPGAKQVTAFKPGFRMLVGNATARTKGAGPGSVKSQTCFRCYTGPNFAGDNAAPCQDATLDTQTLPTKACLGGIRSNILYPTCWDGVNLDSPNHQDHVAYPTGGPHAFDGTTTGGACPSTHPVKIPQLMLEIVWDTTKFNNKADWPADGSNPFYLSTGDNTGYSQHGDYVFGWKNNALQTAMDGGPCTGASCASLKTQANTAAATCNVPSRYIENFDGWIPTLPG